MPDQPVRRPARARGAAAAARRTPPGPCAMVIFGAGGDLTKRLLVPALYNLARTGLMPENFAIVGVDIADRTVEDWRDSLLEMLQSFVGNPASESRIDAVDPTSWNRLTGAHVLCAGRPQRSRPVRQAAARTSKRSATAAAPAGNVPVLPRRRRPVLRARGRQSRPSRAARRELRGRQASLAARGDRKAVRPRPGIGQGAERAHPAACCDENQIYRIDHFLGKETVQNIMALPLRQRVVRADLEPRPHRPRADHRGRDRRRRASRPVLRAHRRAARHGAEPRVPAAGDGGDGAAGRLRRRRRSAARRPTCSPRCSRSAPEDAVRGQYGAGTVLRQEGRGYREEPDVAPDSNVETYVAMRLHIDNWRWAGVPFYLRTGKHMSRAHDRDRHPLQAGARMRRSRTRRSRRCRPTGWCCRSSRTRASRCNSR